MTALSPHHNVVTGRNGAGKSNFFAAIRFVLSDDFARLSQQERKSLLHESSTPTLFASVEIVFDNTDRRIPTASDEVRVKRSIGFQKDDYALNGQAMTRTEIMAHLSVAGFSKSNPYYIVPQGKVTSLTNAKDSERLQLLKDVAGAGVFETKLKDSQKEMNVTVQKQDQIKTMLQDIEGRLDDLSLEKDEYKQYDHLDRERRMIEWHIRDREIKSLQEQIDKIDMEENGDDGGEDLDEIQIQIHRREREIGKSQKELLHLHDEKKLVAIEIEQLEKQKAQIMAQMASLNVNLVSLDAESKSTANNDLAEQLVTVNEEIKAVDSQLQVLNPQITELNMQIKSVSTEINSLTDEQMKLITKKSQSSQFANQSERNAWIDTQIAKLTQSKSQKLVQLSKIESHLAQIDSGLSKLKVNQMESEPLDQIDSQLQTIDTEYSSIQAKSRSLVDARSSLWREEARQHAIISQHAQTLLRSEQDLHGSIDGSISKGISLVQTIASQLGQEDKVYGCLGELITISDKYRLAAEVIAGNSLFHIVVANEQVAELIIKELAKIKQGGRITFIPLNKIQASQYVYPQGKSFVPLCKKISPIGSEATKKALLPAVMHVFGRALVCMNLEVGHEVVRDHGFDAVTLDGDRVDKNGVLSGGYRQYGASKVEFLAQITKVKQAIEQAKSQAEIVKEEVKKLDVEIIQNNSQLIVVRSKLNDLINERTNIVDLGAKIEADLARLNSEKLVNEKLIQDLNSQVESLSGRIDEYETQRDAGFSQSTLTEEEVSRLNEIIGELSQLEKSKLSLQNQMDELELEASNLKSKLSEKLVPTLNSLKFKSKSALTRSVSSFQLDDLNSQVDALKSKVEEIECQIANYVSSSDELDISIQSLEKQIDAMDEEQLEAIELYDELSKQSDRGMVKKTRLRNIQREKEKTIAQLGALPENTKQAHHDVSTSALTAQLAKVNKQLKAFNHVNKKSLDQYKRFAEQKETLVAKLADLVSSQHSIEDLMVVLERRKNEAILRSFKTISAGFTEVFEKLVPDGKGKLVIMKKKSASKEGNSFSLSQVPHHQEQASEDDSDSDDDAEDDNTAEEDGDAQLKSFVGVSIQVSFNSKQNEQQRLKQLSGGQKTLCALALIFAIQRADPAPFYLFDEIDANLDAQYRTAVANLVHELSREAQFICTTFRPEQLKVCDKFYGVMFKNKTSTISEIDQETALGFIENSRE